MPITPLPQFEADLEDLRRERLVDELAARGLSREELSGLTLEDLRRYARRSPPRTLVVRFGSMRMIGEFPFRGDDTPGCGSKLVVKTPRGTEIGEMLTSTCPNAGCGKSVTRQEMLAYIENSGGRDYPFHTEGRVLRVATPEDMDRQAAIEQSKHGLKLRARQAAARLGLSGEMKIVEVEPILGNERVTVYFTSEQRVDFRDLPRELARELELSGRTRIDLRHVGARDEARLTADYEKCGQHCCCKSFLKVLKPISMKSAKVQKATLDPLKISGRCGRLMCCLRYEDATYEELRKNLPNRKKRVGTPEGDGIVLQTQILTQLVLVRLDGGEDRAFPVEEIGEPGAKTAPSGPERTRRAAETRPARSTRAETDPGATGLSEADPAEAGRAAEGEPGSGTKKKRRRKRSRGAGEEAGVGPGGAASGGKTGETGETGGAEDAEAAPKKKRRRRRKKKAAGGSESGGPENSAGGGEDGSLGETGGTADAGTRRDEGPDGDGRDADHAEAEDAGGAPTPRSVSPAKKKRRRRRRRSSGEGSDGAASGESGGDEPGGG